MTREISVLKKTFSIFFFIYFYIFHLFFCVFSACLRKFLSLIGITHNFRSKFLFCSHFKSSNNFQHFLKSMRKTFLHSFDSTMWRSSSPTPNNHEISLIIFSPFAVKFFSSLNNFSTNSRSRFLFSSNSLSIDWKISRTIIDFSSFIVNMQCETVKHRSQLNSELVFQR